MINSRDGLGGDGFFRLLREAVFKLKPHPPSCHTRRAEHTPTELEICTHFLVKTDDTQKSLQPPYEAPHKVLVLGEHTFSLNIGGNPKAVSLDRLKPFFQEADGTGWKREHCLRFGVN